MSAGSGPRRVSSLLFGLLCAMDEDAEALIVSGKKIPVYCLLFNEV